MAVVTEAALPKEWRGGSCMTHRGYTEVIKFACSPPFERVTLKNPCACIGCEELKGD